MLIINHKAAQEKEFELVKKGEYEVTVINSTCEYGDPNDKSTIKRIKLDYEIRSDVQQDHQGQKIFNDTFFITDKAMWKVQAFSKHAQFPDGIQFETYEDWSKATIGKHLIVKVDHRKYEDKVYPEAKSYKTSSAMPPGDNGTPIVSDDDCPF